VKEAMTVNGISMTQKGINRKKKFERLLDQTIVQPNGFVPTNKVTRTEVIENQSCVLKDIEEKETRGHEFISKKIYYCYWSSMPSKDKEIYITCRNDYLQLHFNLKGSVAFSKNGETFYQTRPNT
jgi:hypothetical protein